MKLVSIPYYILHLQYEMPASFIVYHLRICRKNPKYFGSYGTVVDPYTAYYVIRFTSSSTIECSDRENGIHGALLGGGRIVNGTYTLNYPNIHLEYDDPIFYNVPSSHHSEDGVFVDEKCFRIGNKEYVQF